MIFLYPVHRRGIFNDPVSATPGKDQDITGRGVLDAIIRGNVQKALRLRQRFFGHCVHIEIVEVRLLRGRRKNFCRASEIQ